MNDKDQLNREFPYLMGEIAVSLVSRVFRHFGFTVYPYGYEHQFPALVGEIHKWNGIAAEQIRHTPDLLITHQNKNEPKRSWLLEVKSSSKSLEEFSLNEEQFSHYREHWQDVVFACYHFPSGQIYCMVATNINSNMISNNSIDISKHFVPIGDFFDSIDQVLCELYLDAVNNRLGNLIGTE